MSPFLSAAVLIALSAVRALDSWTEPVAIRPSPPAECGTPAPPLYPPVPEAITDEERRRVQRNGAPFPVVVVTLPLMAGIGGSPDKSDFRAEVRALRAEFQKAEQEYRRLAGEANPVPEYLKKFKELADRARGREGEPYALVEIVRLAQRATDRRTAGEAVKRLVKEHVESPALERLANLLGNEPDSIRDEDRRQALESIRDRSTRAKPKAAALFALAVEDMVRNEAASRAALDRLTREFAQTQYAAMAERTLFELDHLQAGQAAPDFEAKDENGTTFKLSDFLGTVTVVDFWGSWSEPCRKGLPQMKALAERFEGRAFAILGVNTDFGGDLHRIKEMMREAGVTWRQAIDGSTRGPISTFWNVRKWPTIYVLDTKGVIRFKNVVGEKLGRVINELLAEMAVKKGT